MSFQQISIIIIIIVKVEVHPSPKHRTLKANNQNIDFL